MDSADWQLLKKHFTAVRSMDAPARQAYLNHHCADNRALRSELESMLQAGSNTGNIIESVKEAVGDLFADTTAAGSKIGSYRIDRKLGQGGMGAVWLASRDDDEYESLVAIKLMHGLSDQTMRDRFLAERQILAKLNHHNIARLLDGGTTESGTPYEVMEYVDGQPIDEFCEQHKLSIHQRLRLFCEVCEAVQYAHRNLIVHRDIKPPNILVTAEGVPKLLDFGIAKLLDNSILDTTQTVSAQRMLTPLYASPEQVLGRTITTTSDIYSLGILLHRILTGELPYVLENDDPLELAKAICEVEPRRPSLLNAKLRGDLDNIVLKALRKEPDSRYASVDELSEDISRHLNRLPVLARPATWRYRLSRFVARHPVPVALGVTAALGLVAATVFSTYQMQQAVAARLSAEYERSVAVNEIQRTTLASASTAIGASDAEVARRLLERISITERGWEWSHLARKLDQSLTTITAPGTLAIGLAGSKLISVDATGKVTWWKGAEIADTANISGDNISKAVASQDGSVFALIRESNQLELWNVANPENLRRLFETTLEEIPIAVAVSHNGDVVSAITESELYIWSRKSASTVRVSVPFKPEKLVTNANGAYFGVVFSDKTTQAYHIYNAQGQSVMGSDAYEVFDLALSPNGEFFTTSEPGNVIRMRETQTNRVLDRFSEHREPAHELRFSADGNRIVTASNDGTIRLWPQDQSASSKMLTGFTPPLTNLQIDSQARYVAALDHHDRLHLWDFSPTAKQPSLKGNWIETSRDSSEIYTLDWFGALRRYDATTLQLFDQISVGALAATAFAKSNDDSLLAIGEYGYVLFLDVETLKVLGKIDLDPSNSISMTFASDDETLLILQANGQLTKLDVAGFNTTPVAVLQPAAKGAVVRSPDRSRFISAQGESVVQWHLTSLRELDRFNLAGSQALCAAYSPDGNIIASGWSDGKIRLFDVESFKLKAELDEHTNPVTALAFSADGNRMVSGSDGAEVWIWNVDTQRTLLRLESPNDSGFLDLAFSEDGKQLIGGFVNDTVHVWDTRTLSERSSAQAELESVKERLGSKVAALFSMSKESSSVAGRLRTDADLSPVEKKAALELALTPPVLNTPISGDPFDGFALDFNGTDDHVLAQNDEGLRMQPAFTVEAWIKPRAFDGTETPLSLRMIFNKEGEYQVAIRPDGSLHWIVAGERGWLGWVPTRYRLAYQEWAHVALVRDIDVIRFYLNGELVQQQSVPAAIGDHHQLKNEFRIGGRQHTPSSFLGYIDEVRVWKSARSNQQIRETMLTPVTETATGLVAAWSFSEGKQSITRELLNTHNGTVVGARWVQTSRR